MLNVREVTKKPKSEGYYRGKMEKNQKQMETGHSVKSRNEQQEPNFAMLHFSSLFALLSFWSLICNAEFDLNSSCLDLLNNFSII